MCFKLSVPESLVRSVGVFGFFCLTTTKDVHVALDIMLFILRGRREKFVNCCVFHFTACGGILNGVTGIISVMSTDYSGDCYWEIQSPLMNSSILLVVEHFQLRSCW